MRELHYLFVMRLPLNLGGSLTPRGIHQSIYSATGIMPYLQKEKINKGDVMIFCSDENASVETARQVTEILGLNDDLNIITNPLWPKSTTEEGGPGEAELIHNWVKLQSPRAAILILPQKNSMAYAQYFVEKEFLRVEHWKSFFMNPGDLIVFNCQKRYYEVETVPPLSER